MKISNYEEYVQCVNKKREYMEKTYPEYLERDKEVFAKTDLKRKEVLLKFPYSVVLVGGYLEHDFVDRWCWQNFGPRNGPCLDGMHNEYTGCPIVLATARIEKGSWTDKDGKEHHWECECYSEVEEHSHEGTWQNIWLIKSGYDYGFGEYCFSSQKDYEQFLTSVLTLKIGA